MFFSSRGDLNAFLRRSIRQGFCSPDLADITVIFDAADETLFCKILSDRNHLLAPLLPNEVCTPYYLRPRRHNRQLTPKVNKLCDSKFIQRMLYKDSYWLSCILSPFYFTCWAAFCQLIINEYCIVLYCIIGSSCLIWSNFPQLFSSNIWIDFYIIHECVLSLLCLSFSLGFSILLLYIVNSNSNYRNCLK